MIGYRETRDTDQGPGIGLCVASMVGVSLPVVLAWGFIIFGR
jgi:hypothetical protein